MTARFVYWMNVTLDLFIDHPVDDNAAQPPEWLRIDEQLHREFNARARGLSMMVEGRAVYEIMTPFWPDARADASLPDWMREYGEIWTDLPKILVSRTRTTADHNTRVIGGAGDDAIAQLAELRQTADGDIARMRAAYESRGELMRAELSQIPGLDLSVPEGAFYQFPRYELDIPSAELVARLRDFGVAVRPGGEFGAHGEHHLRLSYAASEEAIRTGVTRLGEGLAALRTAGA